MQQMNAGLNCRAVGSWFGNYGGGAGLSAGAGVLPERGQEISIFESQQLKFLLSISRDKIPQS